MTLTGWSRIRSAGILLGIGLGGFFDGILLHQILQWHNMLSSVLPPVTLDAMHTNMLWDGVFHAVVWVATLVGVLLLWSGALRSRDLPPHRWLIGWMLAGWGLFNFVEGLVDHQLLGIHHVRGYAPDPAWDLGFLATGPLLVAAGWLLTRSARTARYA